jgi:hypothetical protein
MRRPTKQLADDLLDDSASQEFRSALMDKTLRSARQRKRMRYFNLALSVVALTGIFAFSFQEMCKPATSLSQIHQPILSTAPVPSLNPERVANTKPNLLKNDTVLDSSDSTLVVVQTSESDQPKEINDQELLALAAGKPVALIHQTGHQSELIFLNPKDKDGFSIH